MTPTSRGPGYLAGHRAAALGDEAQTTFRQCLRHWFGELVTFSTDTPDTHGVDIRTHIRSIKTTYDPTHINWQVKARHLHDRPSRFLKEPAYYVPLSDSERRSLLAGCGSRDPFYFVLGIPQVQLAEMGCTPPLSRFHWYAVDLHQYRDYYHCVQGTAAFPAVIVPIRNRLNLATASLLWGATWFRALTTPFLTGLPRLHHKLWTDLTTAATLHNPDPAHIEAIRRAYAHVLGDFPTREKTYLNLVCGDIAACSLVHSLNRGRGGFDQYRSFTSESLADELHMWLFFRVFHAFTFLTFNRLVGSSRIPSIRIYPLVATKNMCRAFRCAQWHVLLWHKSVGARCGFTTSLLLNDHAILAQVGPRGAVEIDNINRTDEWLARINEDNTYVTEVGDMLDHVSRHLFCTSDDSRDKLLEDLSLTRDVDDLKLYRVGRWLLPAEDTALSYPLPLWSRASGLAQGYS